MKAATCHRLAWYFTGIVLGIALGVCVGWELVLFGVLPR